MSKFEAGKTYATRSIVDSETIIAIEIISRTAKTIQARALVGSNSGGPILRSALIEKSGGPKLLRVSEYCGVEQVKPYGSYSMAPIIGADREIAWPAEEAPAAEEPIAEQAPAPISEEEKLRRIVAEFVADVFAAYGAEAPVLKQEWPDLHATYLRAVQALRAAEEAAR